ncbi:prevent-host-death protein [Nostoc sp. 'Peltigera membranacea cyanobiont' 213]|uniref:prevent-host-death protein n=1 Tax=Nostoc sp. 'Peltigera membranacea cyanobiont' 213 TaxID=2014530 RepID=UPI000B9528C2|nr:prevent-host-death protein [Nostoc sp. 'Peltigera membranacea cyanobiont' 213]OYD99435.1 prevent-host-death protein [Nostoc sp. 'Peltigera membranacea cyanobiont' 213]
MNWKLDEAQQKLPEVIDAIASEPQLIFNQDKLVAAIVEPKLFQAFLAWHQQQKVSSFADAFAELRQICAEENYILETPARYSDRYIPLFGNLVW